MPNSKPFHFKTLFASAVSLFIGSAATAGWGMTYLPHFTLAAACFLAVPAAVQILPPRLISKHGKIAIYSAIVVGVLICGLFMYWLTKPRPKVDLSAYIENIATAYYPAESGYDPTKVCGLLLNLRIAVSGRSEPTTVREFGLTIPALGLNDISPSPRPINHEAIHKAPFFKAERQLKLDGQGISRGGITSSPHFLPGRSAEDWLWFSFAPRDADTVLMAIHDGDLNFVDNDGKKYTATVNPDITPYYIDNCY